MSTGVTFFIAHFPFDFISIKLPSLDRNRPVTKAVNNRGLSTGL